VWPWGFQDTPPRGLSHATPLGGCYVTGHDPSPAHAGGRVTPDRGFPPHTPHASHHTQNASYVSQVPPAIPVVSLRLPDRHTLGDCFPRRYVRHRNGDAVAVSQCSFCEALCEALCSGAFTTGRAGLILLEWRSV